MFIGLNDLSLKTKKDIDFSYNHIYETVLQKAVKAAVRAAGINKPASCHTFRHSFAINNWRSRSAAWLKRARMSSFVKQGKSARVSCVVIPAAKYDNTSYTVIRIPRIHGLPQRFQVQLKYNHGSTTRGFRLFLAIDVHADLFFAGRNGDVSFRWCDNDVLARRRGTKLFW